MARRQKNFLDYVPAVSGRNTWGEEDGIVTVHMVHRGFFPWIAQTFFKRPRVSHIRLDAHGSFVFRMIDGHRSIGELALLVHEEFGQEAEPLYDRLAKYMQILRSNEFIYYVHKGEE